MSGPAPLQVKAAADPGQKLDAKPKPATPLTPPGARLGHLAPRDMKGPLTDPAGGKAARADGKPAIPGAVADGAGGTGAAAVAPATPGQGGAGPDGKTPPAKTKARAPGKAEPPAEAANDNATPVAAVAPVTGGHRLTRDRLDPRVEAAAFDAPRSLPVRASTPPSATEATDPDVRRHATVFAEAAAAAARLHGQLVAEAQAGLAAARTAEDSRAAAAQHDLDTGLDRLDRELATARGELQSRADTGQSLVAARAAYARRAVRQAAGSALGTLSAATRKVRSNLKPARAAMKAIEDSASTRADALVASGKKASKDLAGLAAAPDGPTGFPYPSDRIGAAINELTVKAVPPRATERSTFFGKEAGLQETFLKAPITELHNNGLNALGEFEAMLLKAETIGPKAVRQARDTAIDQIDAGEDAIGKALAQAMAASDAALVQQHNGARTQLIEAAEARARAEQAAAEARAGRDHGATMAAARGPALGVRSLAAGMAAETKRPPPQFAQVVIRASTTFRERSATSAVEQRARLAAEAATGRAALDRQSEAGTRRQDRTAAMLTDPLGQSAQTAAAAIADQADKGSDGWLSLAKPVQDAMNGFLPPLQVEYGLKLLTMWLAIGSASASFEAAFRGDPQPEDPNKKKDDKKKGDTGPQMKPAEFKTLAEGTAGAPRDEQYVAGAAKQSPKIVNGDLGRRASGLDDALGIRGRTDVDKVMANLRGLTRRRGSGLRAFWTQEGYKWSLDARIEKGLSKVFTLGRTDKHNKAAAFAHLDGDEAKAAFEEMEAAVVLWNNNDRIKDVHESLSPASAAELAQMEGIGEIRADLNQPAGELFDIYAKVNKDNYKEQTAAAGGLVLKREVDKAHATEGESADDETRRTIRSASDNAGMTAIAGMDKDLDAIDDDFSGAARTKRNADAWQAQLKAFGERADVKAATPTPMVGADGKIYDGPGAALYAYASKSRTYHHQVTNKEGDVIREYDTTHTVSKEQKLWFEVALKKGVHSEDAAAALGVIMKGRNGGEKKDREELEEAFHDKRIDARELENPTKEVLAQRQKDAEDRLARIHDLQATFENGFDNGKRTGKDVAQEWKDWADKSADGDKAKAAYLKGITTSWDGDPAAAWFYAVDGAGKDMDLLKRTTKRLSRDQIKKYSQKYNEDHPEGPPIKERLGIHGKHATDFMSILKGDFIPETSGDDANDMAVLWLGVPQTPLQMLETARMKTKLQYDQGRYTVGRLLASDEFDRMDRNIDRLAEQAGMSRDQLMDNFGPDGEFIVTNPVTGTRNNAGNFNDKGEFVPTNGATMDTFELACTMSQLSADSYKEATDRIANYVSTAIVIAAAIISTFLTGGAAASLWIPVLVTAAGGLLAIGANYAIKGGRYGVHDVGKDLAMTFVQAATAGLGAALGVALKGGLPALRLVAGSLKVSQNAVKAAAATKALVAAGELVETSAAEAAKRTALASLGKELTFGQQLVVGTASSAFAGGATAALDTEAWREGKWGKGIGHGVFRGSLGGGAGTLGASAGSALMGKAFGAGRALFNRPLLPGQQASALASGITRVVGSGSAGFAQSLTEGAYMSGVQGKQVSADQIISDAAWAAVQNAAQTVGEHTVETRQARQQARQSAADAPDPRLPVHANDNEPARIVRPGPEDATPAMRRPGAGEEPATAPAARTAKPRLPGDPPDPAAPRPRKQPPPLPDAAKRAGARRMAPTVEEILFMEPGWGIMAGNPTSKRDAAQIYKNLIVEQPHLEVGVYRNTKTGEYVTFQGDATEVHVGKGASGDTESPQPEGNPQKWKKELLARDEGDWELQAHYHPVANQGETTTERWRQLPSAEGGDMDVMGGESHNRQVRAGEGHVLPPARKSRLHYMVDGEFGHTDFGFDPAHSKPYWVDIAGPTPGSPRRVERFTDLAEYRDFFKRETGYELAAPAPEVAPATSMPKPATGPVTPHVDQPDDYVFHHGTTKEGQAQIEQRGVVARRKPGAGEDFSAAFYVTPSKQVADDYVADRLRKGGASPMDGAVMSFRVSRADMGLVIDIRPNGQHRAQWDAYLAEPSPFAALGADYMAKNKLPATMGDYLGTFGHDRRGEHFEAFLARHGWSAADAIHGDLGGKGTAGIGAGIAGAEQIAIRSQRLADVLSAKLGIKAVIGDEAGVATGRSAGKARMAQVAKSAQTLVKASETKSRVRGTQQALAEDAAAKARGHPLDDLTQTEIDKVIADWKDFGAGPEIKGKDINPGVPRKPSDDPVLNAPKPADVRAIADFNAHSKKDAQFLVKLLAEDPAAIGRVLRVIDGRPADRAAALKAFAQARKAAGKPAAAEAAQLQALLDSDTFRTTLATARERQAYVEAKTAAAEVGKPWLPLGPKLDGWIEESRGLRQLARWDPEYVRERFARQEEKLGKNKFSRAEFEKHLAANMRAGDFAKLGEADATFLIGDMGQHEARKKSGLRGGKVDEEARVLVLKSQSTSGGPVNQGGIDIIDVALPPDPRKPLPKLVDVNLTDNKAERTRPGKAGETRVGTVREVAAQTKNLEDSLTKDIKAMRDEIAAKYASNEPVHPVVEKALAQLEAARGQLSSLNARKVGKGGLRARHRQAKYIAEVVKILQDNGIKMHVTTQRGDKTELAKLLKDYGFEMRDRPPSPAVADDD